MINWRTVCRLGNKNIIYSVRSGRKFATRAVHIYGKGNLFRARSTQPNLLLPIYSSTICMAYENNQKSHSSYIIDLNQTYKAQIVKHIRILAHFFIIQTNNFSRNNHDFTLEFFSIHAHTHRNICSLCI